MPDGEQTGTFEWLIREAGALLRPLETVLSPGELRKLLCVETGVIVPDGALTTPALTAALGQVSSAASQLGEQASALTAGLNGGDDAAVAEASALLLAAVAATVTSVSSISQALQGPFPGVSAAQLEAFAQDLAARLLEILAIRYIDQYLVGRAWLVLLGVVEQTLVPSDPADATQPAFIREQLRVDRAIEALSSPLTYAKDVYSWGDGSFRAETLLQRLQAVLAGVGLTATVTPATASQPAALDCLLGTVREHRGGALPGLELELALPIPSGLALRFPLPGNFAVELSSTAAFERGLVLAITPPADLAWQPPGGALTGALDVRLVGQDPTAPFVLVGETGGSRLEASQLTVGATVSASASTTGVRGDVAVAASIKGGKFVLDSSGGDGFVASFLSGEHFEADVDVGVTWSPHDGLRFQGSGALDVVVPVNRNIGPLQFQALHLGVSLDSQAARIPVELSASVSGKLGPLTVTVDRLGVIAAISFPRTGGNLGPLDFQFDFKPPSGLGIVVDADVVTGGGYVGFDPAKQEYSGMLDLQIADVATVKALGVLTTKLPDGTKGYSLVMIVQAEDLPPIPLGLGFSMTGIGGLLAINRTFDETVLRSGLKNHTLDGILFAPDPVGSAAQIISSLNKVFPPAVGHHLFGPMVKIVWGSPVLITADLALIFEVGARRRLLLLAQIEAILPTRDHDLLRLMMDAVGVIDFDQGTASLDASLHDSRLLRKFALTGDMAMRLAWKGTRNFALAVGGLHPAFNPPPNFPSLDRIAISLTSGDNPRIRCEAYFALTANTRQFGAHAELYASSSGFSIDGEITYDVLLEVNPFAFAADFHAQIQLKHGSSNLFKVSVTGELSGPHPLHVRAKATFEVLWWDVSITVDRTLFAGEAAPVLAPVDVGTLFAAALRDPASWTASLPAGQRPMVVLRDSAASSDVVAHPLATLTVKQSVVPLDLDIARFGQSTPSGERRFSIVSASVGSGNETPLPVKDFFAPAQFLDLTDDEKLSRPSFEEMNAGVMFTSGGASFTGVADDWLEVPEIEFETLIIEPGSKTSRPSNPHLPYQLTPLHVYTQSRFGAVAASDLRRAGDARYRATADKYSVAQPGWNIVATDDMSTQTPSVPGRVLSYAEASQVAESMAKTETRTFAVLRLSDITSVAS